MFNLICFDFRAIIINIIASIQRNFKNIINSDFNRTTVTCGGIRFAIPPYHYFNALMLLADG